MTDTIIKVIFICMLGVRSTLSSVPVPVYLPHTSSSSLLRPVLQFQSTSSQDQPRVWGFFPVIPLHLQAMQVHLDWLIFVGSSLYKDSSSLHVGFLFSSCKDSSSFTAHLNGRDFFEMYWFFFLCVCISIDSVFFVECVFEMLFFYFELYSQ